MANLSMVLVYMTKHYWYVLLPPFRGTEGIHRCLIKVVGILMSSMIDKNSSSSGRQRSFGNMSQEIQDRVAPIETFYEKIVKTHINPENFG